MSRSSAASLFFGYTIEKVITFQQNISGRLRTLRNRGQPKGTRLSLIRIGCRMSKRSGPRKPRGAIEGAQRVPDALHGADRIVGVDVHGVGSRPPDEKVRHGRAPGWPRLSSGGRS